MGFLVAEIIGAMTEPRRHHCSGKTWFTTPEAAEARRAELAASGVVPEAERMRVYCCRYGPSLHFHVGHGRGDEPRAMTLRPPG